MSNGHAKRGKQAYLRSLSSTKEGPSLSSTKKRLLLPSTKERHRPENENTINFRYSELRFPCLEDSDCYMRFGTIKEQAIHHASVHKSVEPYICFMCYLGGNIIRVRSILNLFVHYDNSHCGKKELLD